MFLVIKTLSDLDLVGGEAPFGEYRYVHAYSAYRWLPSFQSPRCGACSTYIRRTFLAIIIT